MGLQPDLELFFMTQDEIIKLANKAFDESSFTDAEVIRFAKLVAQHEREACAKVFDAEEDKPFYGRHVAATIRARGQA